MKEKGTYREAEQYLLDIPRFVAKNTPADTRCFYEALGCPGEERKIIHIAGTNGKGSVCAYLSYLLQEEGFRVGMFTSPHLISMRERFRVNGELMTEDVFVELFETVKARLEPGTYHPSFFESLFFMAMLYFSRKEVDYILLETGLGGRLDATNAVAHKALCVITQIGLDHTEYLGNTLSAIAGEKAGILRAGVPIVFPEQEEEVNVVLRRKAEEGKSPVISLSKKDFRILDIHKNAIDFSYESRYYGYIKATLSTSAVYQVENASLALRALEQLSGICPTEERMKRALFKARWEGRMEEILPEVYVDGAHNEAGLRAFLQSVEKDGCRGKRLLLFAVVRDKDYEAMVADIVKAGLFSRIVLTQPAGPRALPVETLRRLFSGGAAGAKISGYPEAEEALQELLKWKKKSDRIYIAGSLYLAGQMKGLLGRNGHAEF